MPLTPALGRVRQVDLCELKASQVYRVNSRTAKVTKRNPVSRNRNKTKPKQKNPKNCLALLLISKIAMN